MHDVAGWAIFISFFLGLCNLVIASWLASQRAEKNKVDGLAERVTKLEERNQHTPSAQDMASIRELAGEMRGVRRELERIHDRFDKYEDAMHREAAA